MSIGVQQIAYIHSDKEILFENINLSLKQGEKAALIGNNGSGKSTLLKIINGFLSPSTGKVVTLSQPYFVPQHFGQYDNLTVAQALKVVEKLDALHKILNGDVSENNFTILNDDWNIEERIVEALSEWDLTAIPLDKNFSELSGGEKTKIFLAGIQIHSPEIILMDEPTNHLDYKNREKLYKYITASKNTILIVSHDRKLLNLLPSMYELSRNEIKYYSGNYEFYKEQKEIEINSLQARLEEKEKQLRSANKIAREVTERKQRSDVRAKEKHIKARTLPGVMDKLKGKAENSAAKLNNIHNEKINNLSSDLSDLRKNIQDIKSMKTDFHTSSLHTGKILITAKNLNYCYGDNNFLWKEPLNFQIKSGDRIAIKGENGSGKTTLIKLLTKKIMPTQGEVLTTDFKYVYLDQEYSVIDDNNSIYEQALYFNEKLQEHEIKTILNRFLFSKETWDKPCNKLSGGEKMKLALCCLMISSNTPDILIFDEPTNNIDIQNIEILTSTVIDYKGTIILISHDEYFIDKAKIDYTIEL